MLRGRPGHGHDVAADRDGEAYPAARWSSRILTLLPFATSSNCAVAHQYQFAYATECDKFYFWLLLGFACRDYLVSPEKL